MLISGDHYIDGERRKPESTDYFETVDPSSEEVIQTVARGSIADIDAAVEAAEHAMRGPWRTMTPGERGAMLVRLADAMRSRSDDLATIETRDVGKPIRFSRGDVEGCAKVLEYSAGAADKLEGQSIPMGPDFVDFTVLEPIGVTAHIVPWNFPLGIAMRSLAPALAAGCTAVVKPAEQSPLSMLLLADIVDSVGFPPGVINIVNGFGPEAGAALAAHKAVRGITFTGSVQTGRKIIESTSSAITPTVLELGGKNPMIVFDDADMDRALECAVLGGFANSGQVCSSASRLIVHQTLHDAFVEALVERARRLQLGPGAADPDLGPLVSAEQRDKVVSYIEAGEASGATVALAGGRPHHRKKGYFVAPTIFTGVDAGSTIAREEIFGPVVTVQKFVDEEEAVAMANSLDYGLVAGIHTREISRAMRLIDRLEAGSVWINGWSMGGIQAPTGGIKDSGIGKERGLAGIHNYLHRKNVAIRL